MSAICLRQETKAGKSAFVAKQFSESKYHEGQDVQQVTCRCRFTVPLRFAYRCLYCGEFYCFKCAEVHFGETREEHNRKRVNKESSPNPSTGEDDDH